MQKPIIIGLAGKAGSGKDTVGEYLANKHGFITIAFADALKEHIGKGVFALSNNQLYGSGKEVIDRRYNASPRKILQITGTAMREIYKDVWVDTVFRSIGVELAMGFTKFAITDVRFSNESEAIRKHGGVIWKIERELAGAKNGVDNHASEREIEECPADCIIYNNRTLDVLFGTVEAELADILVTGTAKRRAGYAQGN